MPNKFLTPDIIAKEALMQLESNMVMADLVYRDYSSEFAKVGDTITVRKPNTFKSKNFLGQTEAQAVDESGVAVKMNRHRDVTVDVSSTDMTLSVESFSEQIAKPAMQAIAQSVDEDLLASGVAGAGTVIAATAEPTNLKDIADIAKTFDINKVPMADRRLVLHPEHKYRYALTDNLSKVSYAGDNKTLRDALLGRIYSFDTYMDQNCPDTAAATAGNATTYKVSGTKGATQVALSSVSGATGTVKTGDGFILDGVLYRFTEDKQAASNAIASVKIDQKLIADATNAEVTLVKAPHSLAFHKNGLALVTRQLELPMGAAKAAIASANGLAVRVVFGYNTETKMDTVSFDILYGITPLDKLMLVDLVG